MNKWEKEVQESLLKDEQAVLKSLKAGYSRAIEDCNDQIADYMTRIATGDNVQSAVYQMQYQQALKGQLEGVLKNLQTQNFGTISEYLTATYEKGFVGTMYNLQGQGIPLIMPIDQEQVVRAITTNSKISKGLYNHLGISVNKLKTTIASEVTRGIATGSSWEQIASRVRARGGVAYNNAIRIARTEGHRIQQASTMDACRKAKEAGADVVKQWDSTLDKRTRPDHAKLDGQIREVDKPFEVNGYTADAPGAFGVASEDIHCRCCVLQRAKWALDDTELQTLKDRAAAFGLDKTKDFASFQKQYLKTTRALSKPPSKAAKSATKKYTQSELDAALSSTNLKSGLTKTQYNTLTKELSGAKREYQDLWVKYAPMLKPLTNPPARSGAFYRQGSNTIFIDVKKSIATARKYGMNTDLKTLYHEYGHYVDDMMGVPSKKSEFFAAFQADKAKLLKSYGRDSLTPLGSDHNADGVQDILGALGFNGMSWGHAKDYWKTGAYKEERMACELWAHCSAGAVNSASADALKMYFPQSYKAFNKIIKSTP